VSLPNSRQQAAIAWFNHHGLGLKAGGLDGLRLAGFIAWITGLDGWSG